MSFSQNISSLTSRKITRKLFNGAKVSILLFSSLVLFVGTSPNRARATTIFDFPAAHADFLGSASYEAIFGDDPSDPFFASSSPKPIVVGPNIRLNDPQQSFPNGLLGRSETTIAVGENGMNQVAGWNDAQGFCGPPFNSGCAFGIPGLSGYAFSSDGGKTWTDGDAPPNFGGVITRGDPWMAVSDLGVETFLYANLAVDASGADLGVSVHRGTFSGSSFSWNDVRVLTAPNAPNDFYDKEAMAARGGVVIVSVTNFIGIPGPATCTPAGGFGQIEVWRSADGANTFQGPVVAAPDLTDLSDPNCLTGVLRSGSDTAIGKDSNVVVAWLDGPTFTNGVISDLSEAIMAASSGNKGASFSSPVLVHTIVPLRPNPPVGYNRNRINDFPRTAIDRSSGRVYVVFQDATVAGNGGIGGSGTICLPGSGLQSIGPPCPAGQRRVKVGGGADTDIYLSYSDNNGLTWSTPTLITPTAGDSKIQFWPVVTVGASGKVNVVYYESQEMQLTADPMDVECAIAVTGTLRNRSLVGSLVDTWFAQSLDGGLSFGTPVKVSTVSSNWCAVASNVRPNFGDYIFSTTVGPVTYAVWADDRNTVNVPPARNVADVFYASIRDPATGGGGKVRST